MADILNIFTADQLYTLYRTYLLSKNVGLVDFNQGSKTRALIESNSEIISAISMDFKEAIYKSIPVALYDGFGFEKKGAVAAIGAFRLYRKPAFTIEYTGSGTSAKITSDGTHIYSAVTGSPGDAFDFDYTTYSTINDIVTQIDGLANWSATLVKTASIDSTDIYYYTDKEVIGSTDYLNNSGVDIALYNNLAVVVNEGFSISVDGITFLTTSDETMLAGECNVSIAAQCASTGTDGNISAGAIDTLIGQGSINSSISGIEQVKNDSSFSGGSNEETESERRTRFFETINSLNAGTENGIIAAIKNIVSVRSAGIRESYPFRGVNTIIVDDGTGTISSSLLAEVEKVLYGDPNDLTNYPGKNAVGIGYNIVAPVIVPVDVGISIYRLPNINVDLTEIQTDVQTAIEQYINTRSLGEDVLLSEIIRVSKNSNAAVYDAIITSPLTNTSIDEGEFSKTGTGTGGTVTVTVSIAASI
jgi:uncharacterized phage protein gp47/JayE